MPCWTDVLACAPPPRARSKLASYTAPKGMLGDLPVDDGDQVRKGAAARCSCRPGGRLGAVALRRPALPTAAPAAASCCFLQANEDSFMGSRRIIDRESEYSKRR